MAEMENTVDVGMPEVSAADDAQQAQLGEALSSITGETEAEGAEQQPSEPGWIKGRVNAAVTKAVAEAEARIAARYEAQIAELQAERLDRQARDLVQRGEFKSIDTAKEYLQLKGGTQQQPTDAREQHETEDAQTVDPVIQARADLLAAQAHKIRDARGIDVMAAYNQDPEIQKKIASGEWDFYDVADQLAEQHQTPAPVRRSNGAHTEPVSIRNMSEKQWKELNRRIDSGGRYRAN